MQPLVQRIKTDRNFRFSIFNGVNRAQVINGPMFKGRLGNNMFQLAATPVPCGNCVAAPSWQQLLIFFPS